MLKALLGVIIKIDNNYDMINRICHFQSWGENLFINLKTILWKPIDILIIGNLNQIIIKLKTSIINICFKTNFYLEHLNIFYEFSTTINWGSYINMLYIIYIVIIILSSFGILFSKNPIHSVFFLIIIFLHISLLLLLLHVEFLAFLILIVYLGAIAVLFLFVIMMFNIHILESRDNMIRYIPLLILILLTILEFSYIMEWINFNFSIKVSLQDNFYISKNWYNILLSENNIRLISITYNYYLYNFILASLILLVAMIGSIILTLNPNLDLKKQNYYEQNRKNIYNSLVLKSTKKVRLEYWQIYQKEAEEKEKEEEKDE